ncbi:ATP-binding protein [Anaeromyxobacter oryzae]|uniref:Orc1-like AAA ATPase domain-containing protein n=1 Tax=Anaeromyxobacter oryzae TaxID=2918170 RepID=A0ABM7X1M2_9BACT|nr:AAA family ATPase [Anaeromyxobacter oryzae]BDG05646.1 hypothetical protein AMOR_46420 [Anaeromyxobacter oryzae]
MSLRALLGRSRELADLEAALERAIAGHGSTFLLSGEPGIGKTRLAEELAEDARRRGARVVWGRAWEVEGAPACWPWMQILRACAQTRAGASFVDEDPRGSDLAPLLGGQAPRPDDPELASLRLGESVVALLGRLSIDDPLVLVFDDLHACDLASLDLLQRIARELRDLRVLVLGTYREIEARRAPRVSALLARLAREGSARPLGPLDLPAVARWLEDVLGATASPALAEAVFSATEGNPLFVDALSQLLASRGQAALLPGFTLPDSIRETVEERLVRISPDLREVLDAAAVLGRECPLAWLQRVCDRPMERVLAALAEGVSAGVLAPQALPSSPVRFAHVLVREALYQALTAARRVELHARCAGVLKRLPASELDAHLAELAHHCFEGAPAGSWEEAAEVSSRAAVRAMELFAFDDAARHLERALAALDHAGSADDARRAELLWRLGVSQVRMGQGRAGRDTCERAAVLAGRAGRPEIFARAALARGAEFMSGGVDPRLVELLEAALRLGPGSEALRAQVTARLAAAMMPTLHAERPLALAREAIAQARAVGDPRVLAQVLSTARGAFTPAQDLDERLGLDRELASLAAAIGDRILAVQAHGRLALLAVEEGDPGAVEVQLRIQRELADATRVPQHQLRAASTRLLWATLRGDEEEVARAEREVCELVHRVDDQRGLAVLEANRHARARLRGDTDEASAALARMEALLAPDPMGAWSSPIRRAAALADQGRLEEARCELSRFAPEGPLAALSALGPALLGLALPICLRLGDAEVLRSMYERLLPFGARNAVNVGLLVCDGPVAYHLGCLAERLGDRDQAAAHLREAVALCRHCGFGLLEDRARRALEALGPGAPARAPEAEPPPRLHQDGEFWTLSHGGRQARLRDSKGLHYLAALLRDPGRELHVGDLVTLAAAQADASGVAELRASGLAVDGPGDAGELLDARAKAAYRRRLEQLKDALEDAEERGDREGVARLEHERDVLASELARAVGLGGRDRRASSISERARVNVQRRIRDVLTRVAEVDPALARHLELHVKTGVFCSWKP